jgi:hypothetical protein
MLALTSITARNITINKDDPQKEAWAKQLIIDREIGTCQVYSSQRLRGGMMAPNPGASFVPNIGARQ